MRAYAVPLLVGLALMTNACGSDAQSGDAGRDGGDGSGKGGRGGRGGTDGGAGGSTGGSTTGAGGETTGTGGSTAGAGGSTAGTGGSTTGTGGSAGTGGSNGGKGGAAGSGGSTGGAVGTGGSTAGTGGTIGSGGSTAGSGGAAGSAGGSGGATGGSNGGSTGGSTGTGGSAGTGGGVACTSASTCPGGADTECQHKTCVGSVCGLDFTAANTAVASQTMGDCHRNVCDGVGGVMAAILDSDTPADDGNACTAETCVNGLPSHPPEPQRTTCTQSGGAVCNGSASAPACVACVVAADCPGTDTACQRRVCGNQNTCGFANEVAGTSAGADPTGNCRKAVCDNVGGITSAPDDTDVPADDGNPCTDDTCLSGAPSHPTKSDGTACTGPSGAKVCIAAACVQCAVKADCAGTDTVCRQFACQGDHTCGHVDALAGTAAGTDATGNCRKAVCDGAGAVTSAPDDTDKPVDGNSCTNDVCTNGTPSNPNLPPGTLCTTTASAPDGSKVCDGSAGCNPITFRVVRVGPGTTSAATAVAIEEWRTTGGSAVSTINLPAGTSNPLTMSGSASSEGCLSLSADGRYLALAGYGVAASGTTGVKSTVGKRIGALIDVAGTVNTTLFDTGNSGDNVRSATTLDGTDVWIGGAGAGTAGGVWSNISGATVNETHTLLTPDNVRCLAIFGGQLYGSASSGDYTNVFEIGFGTPTTMGQSATSLKGMPVNTTASPFGFTIFAAASTASGLRTMYVADDRSVANGGGIQKWTTSDGTNWSIGPTFTASGVTAGFRGVAGYASGGTVTLLASTAETSPNHLVLFVDTGSGAPTTSMVATAPSNMVYRGVAVSPHFAAP